MPDESTFHAFLLCAPARAQKFTPIAKNTVSGAADSAQNDQFVVSFFQKMIIFIKGKLLFWNFIFEHTTSFLELPEARYTSKLIFLRKCSKTLMRIIRKIKKTHTYLKKKRRRIRPFWPQVFFSSAIPQGVAQDIPDICENMKKIWSKPLKKQVLSKCFHLLEIKDEILPGSISAFEKASFEQMFSHLS